tara:strand:- start:2 stop:238 length:237 start_codon:yes stop_codon:yes gene_type:complete
MSKRQVFFDHRRERGDDGRIFKAGPRKPNHLKRTFKLSASMCIIYHIDDPKQRLVVKRTVAQQAMAADNKWRYKNKGK